MAGQTLFADFSLTTGGETGVDAANAWRNMQDAIDGKNGTAPSADLVKCANEQLVSTRIDLDQGSGDFTNGSLVFQGNNSSFVNDGTRAVLNANNNDISLMLINGPDYIRFENFVFKNTNAAVGNDLIVAPSSSVGNFYDFINCVFDGAHSLIDMGVVGLGGALFYKCMFLNAASNAIELRTSTSPLHFFVGCVFDTISGAALVGNSSVVLIDCFFIDVTGNGIMLSSTSGSSRGIAMNCTFENCADGIQNAQFFRAIGCRFTNNTVAIDSNAIVSLINSYMPDTGQDRANTTKTTGVVEEIFIDGSNSNNTSGDDTDGGYADPANGDFDLDSTKASQYNQRNSLESS